MDRRPNRTSPSEAVGLTTSIRSAMGPGLVMLDEDLRVWTVSTAFCRLVGGGRTGTDRGWTWPPPTSCLPPFERLHAAHEFEGVGVGLATGSGLAGLRQVGANERTRPLPVFIRTASSEQREVLQGSGLSAPPVNHAAAVDGSAPSRRRL